MQHFRLDNGLEVVLAQSRLAPVVAVQAWVGVGSADEKRHPGIAHVFEHMLFKGTSRRGVGEIARTVESAGGDINAWTSFDQTVYHVVVASRFLETGLDVLSDALGSSSFDISELEREREVILEEIRQGNDDPGRAMAQGLFSTAFVRHPYRRPVIGNAESVQSIRRADLLEFFNSWYVANNMTLVVAGDFDERRAREKIERFFGGLPTVELSRRSVREPRQSHPRAAVAARQISEGHLGIGFQLPSVRSEDTAALDVAAIVLGQGESSRLSSIVRRRDELVTGVFSYLHSLRDGGLFIIGATADPDKLSAAVTGIADQTYRLGTEGISQAELKKAKHAIEADAVYMQETAEGMARKYGFYHALTGDPSYETAYIEQVRRLRPEDVRRVAADYLTLDRTNISAVVPDRVARKHTPSKLLSFVEKAASRVARAQTRAKSKRKNDKEVIEHRLDNGLRLVIKRDPSVPIVAARAVWLGGLRIETKSNNGINNLLASTLTRGCGELSADQIIRKIDESASALSAFSGRNTLGVRAEWLADSWEDGFDLMTDCILRPRFDKSEVDRERRRVLEELETRGDNPSTVVFRLFSETLYRRHPYRMDVLGSEESVESVDQERLGRYYRRNYPVSALTLAVVGDVDPARVVARAKQAFGDEKTRTPPARKIAAEQFFGRTARSREVYRYLDRQQAHLIVGFPGTTVDDEDRHGLEVLTTILGGQGGRLFVELRDKEALAYRVGAFSLEGIDPGYIAIYLACSPDKLPAAVAGIRRELDRVADKKVTKTELSRAVKYLVGTHDISLQRRSSVAAALAFYEAYGLGYEEYERYRESIRKVTPEDILRVADKYFDWNAAVTATVMPPSATPAAKQRSRGVRKKAPRKRK